MTQSTAKLLVGRSLGVRRFASFFAVLMFTGGAFLGCSSAESGTNADAMASNGRGLADSCSYTACDLDEHLCDWQVSSGPWPQVCNYSPTGDYYVDKLTGDACADALQRRYVPCSEQLRSCRGTSRNRECLDDLKVDPAPGVAPCATSAIKREFELCGADEKCQEAIVGASTNCRLADDELTRDVADSCQSESGLAACSPVPDPHPISIFCPSSACVAECEAAKACVATRRKDPQNRDGCLGLGWPASGRYSCN